MTLARSFRDYRGSLFLSTKKTKNNYIHSQSRTNDINTALSHNTNSLWDNVWHIRDAAKLRFVLETSEELTKTLETHEMFISDHKQRHSEGIQRCISEDEQCQQRHYKQQGFGSKCTVMLIAIIKQSIITFFIINKPVSQSCAVAKSENLWRDSGQSNLVYKCLAVTKVWFCTRVIQLHFGQWGRLPFCLASLIIQRPVRVSHSHRQNSYCTWLWNWFMNHSAWFKLF